MLGHAEGEQQVRQLRRFENLAYRKFSDRLWEEYEAFVKAVKRRGPKGASLRNKDRYLWARSLYEGIRRDVRD